MLATYYFQASVMLGTSTSPVMPAFVYFFLWTLFGEGQAVYDCRSLHSIFASAFPCGHRILPLHSLLPALPSELWKSGQPMAIAFSPTAMQPVPWLY